MANVLGGPPRNGNYAGIPHARPALLGCGGNYPEIVTCTSPNRHRCHAYFAGVRNRTRNLLKHRILVADDEPDVLRMVGSSLANAGFEVVTAGDGPSALEVARRDAPVLVVLDIMMPGMTGLEVTRELKREPATSAMSIVLVSARNEEIDRILGFELGVDDFVSKPFSPRELVLRVKAIIARTRQPGSDAVQIQIGDISVDRERHDVTTGGEPANLTAIEFKLLFELMRAAGRVLTREGLIDRVWGSDAAIETRTIDTHLRRLREKLGAAGSQIQTVRGFGYRLEAK